MSGHPPVEIKGGDVFTHDVEMYDEDGEPISIVGHSFSFKMRRSIEGSVIVDAVGTFTPITNGIRFEMSAAVTTILAAEHDKGVYAIRDDTLQVTILDEVEAVITRGIAS